MVPRWYPGTKLHLADVVQGKDPARQRTEHRAAETLDIFSKRYMTDHAKAKKKSKSAVQDQWMLDRYILPKLGSTKVTDLSSGEIARLMGSLSDRPYLANRCRSLLSKMCSLAVTWEVRRDRINPVQGVEKYPEHSRERYLTRPEFSKLSEVLSNAETTASEPRQEIAAIRLLMFTGCRRGEVLSLQWSFIDRENDVMLLPESKTGRKTIYLNDTVLAIIDALPHEKDAKFFLPGRTEGSHFEGVPHVWERLRAEAGLHTVRLHDLRHTYASMGAALGLGLPQIGALLCHTNPSTTAKYAHLAADPTRLAGARIARQLHAQLADTANVISFAARRKAKGKEKVPKTVRSVASARKAAKATGAD